MESLVDLVWARLQLWQRKMSWQAYAPHGCSIIGNLDRPCFCPILLSSGSVRACDAFVRYLVICSDSTPSRHHFISSKILLYLSNDLEIG